MNYDNPQLRELLSGQYVLGHMSARARARFERLLLSRADYAREVTDWEERLTPMLYAAQPQKPPRRVWRRLQRRVKKQAKASSSSRSSRFGTGGLALAGVATAAFLIVLGLYLARPPVITPPPPPSQYAMITTQQGVARWLIFARGRTMHMHAVGHVAPPAGKSYELWMLPGSGANPVSLGLLPTSGEASEQLSDVMLTTLNSAKGLAVSVEPQGGSPTGQPTGAVVFTAAIADI